MSGVMIKINLKLKINDYLIENIATLKDNKIMFVHDNVNYEFDINELILKRENEEFLSIMNFKSEKNNNFYLLKEVSKEIINNLVIKELQVLEKMYIIRYEIDEIPFNLTLSYKEV